MTLKGDVQYNINLPKKVTVPQKTPRLHVEIIRLLRETMRQF